VADGLREELAAERVRFAGALALKDAANMQALVRATALAEAEKRKQSPVVTATATCCSTLENNPTHIPHQQTAQ
jgi:hypothetical protein